MKFWWGNIVKDYLTFSKKERNGIFIIILLGISIYLISRYLPVNNTHINPGAFQKELAKLTISTDSSSHSYANQPEEVSPDYYRPKPYGRYTGLEGELFAFDPNTLDVDGWKRLGVREKTINIIQNFLAKGYRFRQPDDIRKIYGLHQPQADRLIPYVRITEKEAIKKPTFQNRKYTGFTKKFDAEPARIKIIDINAADTSAFISLPGIGSKLALRIVNFRQRLGGFSSVDQLSETYGIADSTFQKMKSRLQCNNPVVKKININTADANELKGHPYIKWNFANAIVNYRSQHGAYKSVDELRKIQIISDELFYKIAPYLIL